MDDATQLAQANDMIQQQQKAHPSSAASEPRRVTDVLGTVERMRAKLAAMPDPTPEEIAERANREGEREVQRRCSLWASLASLVGRRYAGCTLDDFQAETGPQQIILERMRAYVANVETNVREGRGVLLYGPPGTGKDHLATAIMRAAVLDHGLTAHWTDGAEFYGTNRDSIDGTRSEREVLATYRNPDLLVMSDPVPPLGKVDSTFQLSMLFRVIDRRYRDCKATVMTLNVKDRDEAERRLSPNIIDRVAHGALAVNCNWASFRR